MTQLKKTGTRIFGIALGIAIFLAGVYGIFHRLETKVNPVVAHRDMKAILSEDRSRLSSMSELKQENMPSLMRLARERDSLAEAKIESLLKLAKSSKDLPFLLKASGFFLLSKFEKNLIDTLENTKDESLKTAAIEGLANAYSEPRKKLLREAYANKKNSDKIHLTLIEALFKLRPDPEQRIAYADELVKYLKNTSNKNLFYAFQIFLNNVTELNENKTTDHPAKAPAARPESNPQNLTLIRGILTSASYDAELRTVALTSLIQKEDSWLKDNYLHFFLEPKNNLVEPLMSRFILNLSKVCPVQRWDIIPRILSDKLFANYKSDILNVIGQLNEQKGIDLLTELINAPQLTETDKYKFHLELNHLQVSVSKNKKPCP